MSRFTSLIVALVVALAATSGGAAQTRSANASASIHVDGVLSLSATQNIVFKSHFITDGIVNTNADGTQAIWSWNTTPGAKLAFAFVIPAALAQAAPSTATVPFACGSTSAFAQDAGGFGVVAFNPSAGLASYGPVIGSTGLVHLGQDAGTASCTVDLTSSARGDYSGTIQLTVTVL